MSRSRTVSVLDTIQGHTRPGTRLWVPRVVSSIADAISGPSPPFDRRSWTRPPHRPPGVGSSIIPHMSLLKVVRTSRSGRVLVLLCPTLFTHRFRSRSTYPRPGRPTSTSTLTRHPSCHTLGLGPVPYSAPGPVRRDG